MKKIFLFMLLLPLSISLWAEYPYRSKPKVYIECHIQEFGKTNKAFAVQLANALRENGWIIQNTAENADYVLVVNGEAREFTRIVTREDTTYTYHKRRDTLLVVDATSSSQSLGANNANIGEMEIGQVSTGNQASTTHQTIVRDTIIAEAHITPVAFMYFAYMDAHITFSKRDEVLYEDFLEVKEGHTLNYAEAAKKASKEVIHQLTEILPTKTQRK